MKNDGNNFIIVVINGQIKSIIKLLKPENEKEFLYMDNLYKDKCIIESRI